VDYFRAHVVFRLTAKRIWLRVIFMNAAAKNTKTAAVCITITRAEGPTHLCKTRVFAGLDCWEKSRAFMRANLDTFPASGGYDKHDFTVVFGDGETYEGRLDAKANGEDCDVQAHVRDYVRFLAGLAKPAHMTDAQYAAYVTEDKDEAAIFLAKYDLG